MEPELFYTITLLLQADKVLEGRVRIHLLIVGLRYAN